MGRIVAESGWVAGRDPFAFTSPDKLWVDHEWLSGVAFYQLATLGGAEALSLFKYGAMLLTLLLLGAASRRVHATKPLLFCSLTVVCYSVWYSTVRSQPPST